MNPTNRLSVGALALGIWMLVTPTGAEEAKRTVSLSGSAMVKSAPDEVLISLGVELHQELPASKRRDFVVGTLETLAVSAPLLASAQAQVEQAVKKVRATLKDLGVEDRCVQTDSFQVEPGVWQDDGVSYFRGYLCRQGMTVLLKEPAKADTCVDAVLRNGGTHIYAVAFNTSRVRALRDDARKAACKAAREKADLLAGELGAKVKRVLSINEGASSLYCGKNWGNRGYGGSQQAYFQNAVQSEEYTPAVPGEGEISSGEVGISASVSVTFELE